MLEAERLNWDPSLSPRKKKSQKETGAKLVTGERARSIYKEPVELQKALTKAGLAIQEQEAIKNLGPVLGKRLKQLSAEHAGGDEVILSARKSKLADLKRERADEDKKQAESLRSKIASAGVEIEVKEEDIIDTQEIPSDKTKTSEQGPTASGEISNEYELGKKKITNKNVISRASHEIKDLENGRQQAKESRSDEAQVDYVKAYKEYDPRFTKNKLDDLIAKTKPPFFAFGKAARELKRLYGVMVRAEESKIGGLSPEARKAIADSARKEEEEFIASNKHLAPKK